MGLRVEAREEPDAGYFYTSDLGGVSKCWSKGCRKILPKFFSGDGLFHRWLWPVKHGYGYLVECSCVGHADTHRIRVGYVFDTPHGVSLTK